MKRLSAIFFLIIFNLVFSFADEIKTIDLTKYKWEYRWGDSPFKRNIPIWTIKDQSSKEWKEIKYPINPPNRNNQTNVWYRVKLPKTLTNDPHVYIFSMDIIPEVYYEGRRIYHFGKLNEQGKGEFSGWPWHMFSIPKESADKYLYFRIYSDYLDIGLFGEVLIGSKGDILERILEKDIPKIMVSSVSIFVAVILLFSFLSKSIKIELFILGSLFLTQGLNVFSSVKIIQMYLFYPLLNQYILAISFFYFPVGMALFMDKTIKYKIPFSLIKRIWQVHLLYIIAAVCFSLLGFFDIPTAYVYFDKLFYFITMPILTIFMIYFFFKGDIQTKLITLSFLIVLTYWIYSFLIAYHFVQWVEYPSDVAIFLCLLLLSYAIVKKLNYTSELENEKEKLAVLSSTDYLTKLYNRKEIDNILKTAENIFKRYKDDFSIILLDIDDFKKVNDTYGHLVGDKLLIELGEILSENTRDVDLVGRWGGEEFLIVCPKARDKEAIYVAENLRKKIEIYDFEKIGKKTASFGVASYKENDSIKDLLHRADEAMYKSKTQGKNKVSFK